MRRGRPQAAAVPVITPNQSSRPSPSPARVTQGDPFAALDSKPATSAGDVNDVASRFPSLDQFSILHEKPDSSFEFEQTRPTASAPRTSTRRLTDGDDDDDDDVNNAFAIASAMPPELPSERHITVEQGRLRGTVPGSQQPIVLAPKPASAPPKPVSEMSRASMIISNNPELQAIASPPLKQTLPTQSSRNSSVPSAALSMSPPPRIPQDYPPIHRFPPAEQFRAPTLQRPLDTRSSGQLRTDAAQAARGPAFTGSLTGQQHQHPSSSRPSLEGGRPSFDNLEQLQKSSSSFGRPRPSSTYLESNLDYLRDREAAPRPLKPSPSPRLEGGPTTAPDYEDESAIESNVDFLRSMEETDSKKDKSSKHGKRGSLASLSGTKNILAGRFGDAFKRFESSNTGSAAKTPSPLKEHDRFDLTPIAGSEATDGRSDDGVVQGEPELNPEVRREREAQALAEEERRVEAAAAEYKIQVAARGSAGAPAALPKSIGGVSRAVSIQNRVQALLDESQNAVIQRTASGYGQFSDKATAASRVDKELPALPRKPVMGSGGVAPLPRASTLPNNNNDVAIRSGRPGSSTTDPGLSQRPTPPPKPSLAPKPTHLNAINTGGRPKSPPKPQHMQQVPPQDKEDYLQDFSKRYPSLAAIEMVEQDIGAGAGSNHGADASRTRSGR